MTEFDPDHYSLISAKGIKSFYAVTNSRFHLVHYKNISKHINVNHLEVVDEDCDEDNIFFAVHAAQNGQAVKVFPSVTRDIADHDIERLLTISRNILNVRENAEIIVTPRLVLSNEETEYYFRENSTLIETATKLNNARKNSAPNGSL